MTEPSSFTPVGDSEAVRQSGTWGDLARRAIARDTLLHLAAAAEAALDVETNDEGRRYQPVEGESVFQTAMRIHLTSADNAPTNDMRAKHLAFAADLLEFCAVVGEPLACDLSALALRTSAHALLLQVTTRAGQSSDLTAEVDARLRLGRTLRICGNTVECDSVLNQTENYFYRTGAEHYHWEFEAQRVANVIDADQPFQALGLDGESGVWDEQEMARGWLTEHRFGYMRALVDIALGLLSDAEQRLDDAYAVLTAGDSASEPDDAATRLPVCDAVDPTRGDIRRISLLLSRAEARAAQTATRTDSLRREAVHNDLSDALDILSGLRIRWRVVARSRSPLARAFHRMYGEISLIASRLEGSGTAAIGLRVALAVKQTGFAGLLRTDRSLLEGRARKVFERIVIIEDRLARSTQSQLAQDSDLTMLDKLHRLIEDAISPLLAQLATPAATDLRKLDEFVGSRDVLDLVTVQDVYGRHRWFRTWLRRGSPVSFEHFELGEKTCLYLFGREISAKGEPADKPRFEMLAGTSSQDDMWRVMGVELLPTELLNVLGSTPRDAPVELIISPHDALGLIPWAALHVDDRARPMVEAALITHIPALTFLSNAGTLAVEAGSALTWLDRSVRTADERRSWSPNYPTDSDLAVCDLTTREVHPKPGTLAAVLAREPGQGSSPWALVHIASHGDGVGLSQRVKLTGGDLIAGRAIGLLWPGTVALAACQSGRVENLADVEPFGFVTAVMAAGARTVVAGLLNVSDRGTEALMSTIVPHIRPGVRLHEALRRAQLEMVGQDVDRWALMTAFVR